MRNHVNMKSTLLYDKCCCRVNTKRGNYIFGIINIFLRFILVFPIWDLTNTFDEENGYKFLTKAASIWLLLSSASAFLMIYGIWNHQPMHVLPFLIVIYCETATFAILSVVLAALFGSQAKTLALSVSMATGWILTGLYLYYSFVIYRMYKQMLANPFARYIYIT